MENYRLAVLGFGNVGQGLALLLRDRGDELADRFGMRVRIVAISDPIKGSVYDPDGLDPAVLLEALRVEGNLGPIEAPQRGWDAARTIDEADADVVVELSPTDLRTGEPAFSHLRLALQRGRHVVTSNKGPIALHWAELSALARSNRVELGVEGTVMSGTPALRLAQDLLAGAGIRRIEGILNGTTNYILTRMAAGIPYDAALTEAQANGYAEADPTGDVEGHDAAAKVVILANLLLDLPLTLDGVDRLGITRLTPQDIAAAEAAGERWKLLGRVERTGEGVAASVGPVRLPRHHPLASVDGATNAITYGTEVLGDLTLVGPGAGRLETAYGLVGDLLAIHRRRTGP